MKLWENPEDATSFMAIHLLNGQTLAHGPSFRITPDMLEPLPLNVPLYLGVSLGATPQLVPIPVIPAAHALGNDPDTHTPLAPTLAATLRHLEAAPDELPGLSGPARLEVQPDSTHTDEMVASPMQNLTLEVNHEEIM